MGTAKITTGTKGTKGTKKGQEELMEYMCASWGNAEIGHGTPQTLIDFKRKFANQSVKDQINRAQLEYSDGNEMIQSGCDLLIDAGSSGFQNEHADKPRIKEYYDDICRKFNFDGIVRDMFRDHIVLNNIVLYWHVTDDVGRGGLYDKTRIDSIMCLDPSSVTPLKSFRPDVYVVQMELDRNFIDLVKKQGDYAKIEEQVRQKILTGYPQRWIDAARFGKTEIVLSEDEGDHILIENDARRGSVALAKPKMAVIFDALDLRKMLIDGDWSAAYLTKFLILLFRLGEQGPPADPRSTYAKESDSAKLKQELNKPGRSQRLFGPHHLQVDFKYPNPEIFGSGKYEAVESRILRWLGMNPVFVGGSGGGGTYASAYLNVRALLARIAADRRTIGRLIERFYEKIRPTDKRIMGKTDSVPSVTWDEQVLEDPRWVLERVKFLMDEGVLSGETSCEKLGFEPREELARNEKDWLRILGEDKKELAKKLAGMPRWEKAQGLLSTILPQLLGFVGTEGIPGAAETPGRPIDRATPRPEGQEPRPTTA